MKVLLAFYSGVWLIVACLAGAFWVPLILAVGIPAAIYGLFCLGEWVTTVPVGPLPPPSGAARPEPTVRPTRRQRQHAARAAAARRAARAAAAETRRVRDLADSLGLPFPDTDLP